MSKLPALSKEQFESKLRDCNENFEKGDYNRCIFLLEEAWDFIPDPKGIYSEESYHLVKDIIHISLKSNDFSKANEWAGKLFLTGYDRIDSGDKEFLSGRVAFELGDFETAKEFFRIGNDKSEGRCFGSAKNAKYLKFFKS
ncbi:hypothetical protein [Gorillibacterium sp. CAU 1737]|uniref:hypothetical protein n=1 Tax=Gorillibacterium sp. CAU 1737 TaxID=3140362 RepID=UPI003261209E